jgi:HlyD family secretion protein
MEGANRQKWGMKRFVLFTVFILIVGLGANQSGVLRGLGGWLSAGAAAASPQFMTAPVERGSVHRTVTTTGTLQALVTVEVGTQLSGQIAGCSPTSTTKWRRISRWFSSIPRPSRPGWPRPRRQAQWRKPTWTFSKPGWSGRASICAMPKPSGQCSRLASTMPGAARGGSARARTGRDPATARHHVRSPTRRGAAARDQAAASLREAEAIAAAHEHASTAPGSMCSAPKPS